MKGSTGLDYANHVKERLKFYEIPPGQILGITTDNASVNGKMTKHISSMFKEEGVDWEHEINHMPCMAHVIQLSLSAFFGDLKVKGREKSWALTETDELLNTERERDEEVIAMENGAGSGSAATTRTRKKASKPKHMMSVTAKSVVNLPKGFNKIIEKVRACFDLIVLFKLSNINMMCTYTFSSADLWLF